MSKVKNKVASIPSPWNIVERINVETTTKNTKKGVSPKAVKVKPAPAPNVETVEPSTKKVVSTKAKKIKPAPEEEIVVPSTKKVRVVKYDPDIANHILIRIRSEDGKTIQAHDRIIGAKGSAILGKIGKGLGADFIEYINKQIARDLSTYLFLTTREGWNGPYVTYMCRLKRIETQLTEDRLALVPRYYTSDYKNIETWFEISTIAKMSKSDMNRIYVISSGREIMSVIGSSASIFHVRLKERSTV